MPTISWGSLWSLANILGLFVCFLRYLADILGRFMNILGCFVPTISCGSLWSLAVILGLFLDFLGLFVPTISCNPLVEILFFAALRELLVVFGRYLGALSGFLGALCANNFLWLSAVFGGYFGALCGLFIVFGGYLAALCGYFDALGGVW